MASSTAKTKVFDSEEASATVKNLREAFVSGKTRSYEWRVSQLKAVLELTEKHEQEIFDALFSDLAKSEAEAFIQEVHNISIYTIILSFIYLLIFVCFRYFEFLFLFYIYVWFLSFIWCFCLTLDWVWCDFILMLSS